MDIAQVNAVMETAPKGANIVLSWIRDAKTRKNAPKVRKAVRMVGRIGVEYDNLASVVEKRSNGELPKENKGETWWEWVKHPFLVQHKRTKQQYVRMYSGTSKKTVAKRQFFVDGEAVSFESVEEYLLASEKKSSHGDTFMVKIEDLTAIRSETADYADVF